MDEFIRMCRMMRYCHIGGRYGGGKTTLALMVADRLIASKAVSRVVVNTPLNLDVPYFETWNEAALLEIEDAVLVIDEAGQFLDAGSSNSKVLKQWFSYLRKRNQILLMPSVLPVLKFAAAFRCQRIFNGLQMGIPMWLYRWRLGLLDLKDTGLFMWWYPSRVFGLFDTDYEPKGSWYIYDFSHEARIRGRVHDRIGAIGVGSSGSGSAQESQVSMGIGSSIYASGNSHSVRRNDY